MSVLLLSLLVCAGPVLVSPLHCSLRQAVCGDEKAVLLSLAGREGVVLSTAITAAGLAVRHRSGVHAGLGSSRTHQAALITTDARDAANIFIKASEALRGAWAAAYQPHREMGLNEYTSCGVEAEFRADKRA
jgi:hypothetical protein